MTAFLEDHETTNWTVIHPLGAEDQATTAAMRATLASSKGKLQGTEARVPFESIVERVAPAERVVYEADHVGGIPGWWCRPEGARPGEVVMHIHGGWFNWGSARVYRNLAGQIAARAGVSAFVPDYRLAPEHPFPAAADDVRACYAGLAGRGFSKIAITGDSAGGNLALGLLVYLAVHRDAASEALVGGVALSPVTDLSLSGNSWSTRAEADPIFTLPQVTGLVQSYLASREAADPYASPLRAALEGIAPLLVHVGNDEVLLDDSVRFVERAVAAGVHARLHVWEGMLHGFLQGVGRLAAADEALQLVGAFLDERFSDERFSRVAS